MSDLTWDENDDDEPLKPDDEEELPKTIVTAPPKQEKNIKKGNDEDWENELEKEKERKKKAQQEKEEKEKKKLKQQQKSLELNKKKKPEPVKKQQQPTKTLSKDEEELLRQKTDLQNAQDLIDNQFAKKSIELLKPKNERDFNELADLMSEKAVEFVENKQYVNFIKRLIENCTHDMKMVDQKAVSQHLANLIKKREEDEKQAKNKPSTKKQSKITLKVDDPYEFGGGGTAFDDDDSFM